jgi:hypothetical protein
MRADDALKYAAALLKDRTDWTLEQISYCDCGDDHETTIEAIVAVVDEVRALAARFGDPCRYSDGRPIETSSAEIIPTYGAPQSHIWHRGPRAGEVPELARQAAVRSGCAVPRHLRGVHRSGDAGHPRPRDEVGMNTAYACTMCSREIPSTAAHVVTEWATVLCAACAESPASHAVGTRLAAHRWLLRIRRAEAVMPS